MKNKAMEQMLRRGLDCGPVPRRLEETVSMCREQTCSLPARAEARQGFWAFLSDVFRLEGPGILLLQAAVLGLVCFAVCASAGDPCEIPMYMPLFMLAAVPALFRGQYYRVSELEAATRVSGAQLALARMTLAGAAALICMTVLLGLEIWLQRSYAALGRMVLYCLVPYLVGMTVMLCLIRRRRDDGIALSTVTALGSCAFWYATAQAWPWLYGVSAAGVWLTAFILFTAFFARETLFIIRADREGRMYGIVDR